MSADEILEAIFKYCNNRTKDTIETTNELISQITDNPKQLAYDLSEAIESFSLEKGKCPLCGEDIVQIGRNYEASEYYGQPVQEINNTYGCDDPNCGYIK